MAQGRQGSQLFESSCEVGAAQVEGRQPRQAGQDVQALIILPWLLSEDPAVKARQPHHHATAKPWKANMQSWYLGAEAL